MNKVQTITVAQCLIRAENAAVGLRAKAANLRNDGDYAGATSLDSLAAAYTNRAAKIRRIGCTALLKGKHQDRSKYRPADVRRLGIERGVGRPRKLEGR
jgi:hypothetical protein